MDATSLAILVAAALVLAVCLVVVYQGVGRQRAERRAEALVRQLLTSDELRQLEGYGYLDVTSRSTPGRIYRIPARPGLVAVIEAHELVVRLCFQPTREIPPSEHVLVHKLLLEGAEDEYLLRANHVLSGWWPRADSDLAAVASPVWPYMPGSGAWTIG